MQLRVSTSFAKSSVPPDRNYTHARQFLIFASDYRPNPGGIATYIDTLARGLISAGFKAKVLALVHPEDKQRIAFLENYEEWVEPFPVAYDERPKSLVTSKLVSSLEMVRCAWPVGRAYLNRMPCFRWSSEAIVRFSGILAREKPTTVIFGHLHINFYPFVFPLLECCVPYGVIAHDSEIRRTRHRLNDLVRRGMLVKKASWIAANSWHTKSLLDAWGLPSERILVIHPPLAEEAIRKSSQSFVTRSQKRFTLLTVCRLVRGKGVDIVLRALKLLRHKNIPFTYIIAGDGPERENLEQVARNCGVAEWTRFAGYVTDDEKWALFQSADVFVMPSRVKSSEQHEGFGIAFVEAAAFGVPAIGTRAGGIPDAVVDGETGILVAPESPSELAEALAFLYSNRGKGRELGEAGKKRAQTQFSPTMVAASFAKQISKRG